MVAWLSNNMFVDLSADGCSSLAECRDVYVDAVVLALGCGGLLLLLLLAAAA